MSGHLRPRLAISDFRLVQKPCEWSSSPIVWETLNSFSASRQAPPTKQQPDLLATKHWLFPLNQPRRDYQFNISKHCLFDNTLVALPTGLGKTFIAGVVMLNCKNHTALIQLGSDNIGSE